MIGNVKKNSFSESDSLSIFLKLFEKFIFKKYVYEAIHTEIRKYVFLLLFLISFRSPQKFQILKTKLDLTGSI